VKGKIFSLVNGMNLATPAPGSHHGAQENWGKDDIIVDVNDYFRKEGIT
jgi:hypothetical protein